MLLVMLRGADFKSNVCLILNVLVCRGCALTLQWPRHWVAAFAVTPPAGKVKVKDGYVICQHWFSIFLRCIHVVQLQRLVGRLSDGV